MPGFLCLLSCPVLSYPRLSYLQSSILSYFMHLHLFLCQNDVFVIKAWQYGLKSSTVDLSTFPFTLFSDSYCLQSRLPIVLLITVSCIGFLLGSFQSFCLLLTQSKYPALLWSFIYLIWSLVNCILLELWSS